MVMKNIPPKAFCNIDKDLKKTTQILGRYTEIPRTKTIVFFSLLVSQILNAITCAQLALILLRSLDHMGGRFSLSQGCNVTS